MAKTVLEITVNELTLEDYLDAFRNTYNYDDIDEADFYSEKMKAIVEEDIEDYKDGGEIREEDLAEFIKEKLYEIQYGDTCDADDMAAISEDYYGRFPDGREML